MPAWTLAQFQVNTATAGSQYNPEIDTTHEGGFVVAWESHGYVQSQRFAPDGTPEGGEFQVNTYTTGMQTRPAVTVASNGDFAIVWESDTSSGDPSEKSDHGQRYASDGVPLGEEFQINGYTTGDQFHTSVAFLVDDRFAVTWESEGSTGSDVSVRSIQGKLYPRPIPVPTLSRLGALGLVGLVMSLGVLQIRGAR